VDSLLNATKPSSSVARSILFVSYWRFFDLRASQSKSEESNDRSEISVENCDNYASHAVTHGCAAIFASDRLVDLRQSSAAYVIVDTDDYHLAVAAIEARPDNASGRHSKLPVTHEREAN
jgi:hypothetical protein